MRFKLYSRGSVVAYAFDAAGAVGFRRPDGRGLLRTSDGIPRPVVERGDVADVVAILSCIASDADEGSCQKLGVEVVA